MAYIDPRKQQQQGLAPTLGAATSAPSQNAAPAGGSAPAPASQAPVGTGFVNPGAYLDANRGAGQQMANTIAGNVSSAGQGFQADLGKYMQDFSHAVTAGTHSGGGYDGPQDAQSYDAGRWGDLTSRASDIGSRARMAGTAGGLAGLMGEQYAAPGYSNGEQGFDAFLAGGAGGKQLSALSGLYGGLYGALGNASDDASKLVTSTELGPPTGGPRTGPFGNGGGAVGGSVYWGGSAQKRPPRDVSGMAERGDDRDEMGTRRRNFGGY